MFRSREFAWVPRRLPGAGVLYASVPDEQHSRIQTEALKR